MGELFAYTLEAGIILVFLYLVYKLLLAGEKQSSLNRCVLAAIYVMSLAVPVLLCRFSFCREGDIAGNAADGYVAVEFGNMTGGILPQSSPGWLQGALWVYMVGSIATAIYLLWGVLKLMEIIRKGEKRDMGDFILVITHDRSFSPFSWRRYVVVGDESELAESGAIITHELAHIMNLHRLDLVLAQLYAVLMWYNPVAWLMMEELKAVHEYQADEAVINSGVDLREYQMLLIKKAVGSRLPLLANSLNHSKLHKRITMMYKSKSKMAGRMGVIALVPAMAIGMAVVSIPAVASALSEASETALIAEGLHKVNKNPRVLNETPLPVATPEVTEDVADAVVSEPAPAAGEAFLDATEDVVDAAVSEPEPVAEEVLPVAPEEKENVQEENAQEEKKVYVTVEKLAEFPGGMGGLMKWLSYNISYPKEAQDKKVQGRVIVKFVITKEGKIRDAIVIKGVDRSLDNEALRVVKSMPDWIPGEVGGKKVDSYFNLPVTFKLTKETNKNTGKTK